MMREKRRGAGYLMLIVATIVGMVAILYYYFVDPAGGGFALQCPFHLLTGLDCPSCGSQRAFHAVLHGEFREAVGFNPFLVVSLPYLAGVIWGTYEILPGGGRMRKVCHSQLAIYIYLALMLIWWVIRNII